MKLYYKEALIKSATKYVGSSFWEEILVKYAKRLECPYDDYYDCLFYLSTLDDSLYCGVGVNERANCYLYKRDGNELYWFFTDSDAADWANIQNGFEPHYYPRDAKEKGYSWSVFFVQYRAQHKNGFHWLLPEDIPNLEEILGRAPLVHCIDSDLSFASRALAAKWLYDSGRAASFETASKALNKHLVGETQTCYKLRFEER